MEKKTFSRIGWTFVLYSVAGGMVITLLALSIDMGTAKGYNTYIFTSQTLYYAIILGIVVLMLKNLPRVPEMPKQRMFFSDFVIFFVISFSFLYLGAFIGGMATQGLADLVDGMPVNPVETVIDSVPLWLTVFLNLILAPVFEELIFRKYILDTLRPFGDKTACLLCGFLFGIFHMNLDQFFYAFFLGTLFSYIVLRTGNVIYTMALHSLINLFGSLIIPELYGYFEKAGNNAEYVIDDVIWIIVAAGLVLFAVKCRKMIFDPPYFSFSRKIDFSTIFINGGFIAMLILFVAEAILTVKPSWLNLY